MSIPIVFLLWAFVPIVFVVFWLRQELKNGVRALRISAGVAAAIAALAWMLALANSVNSYYDEMRTHELVQAVVHSSRTNRAAIDIWSTTYPNTVGIDRKFARKELENIVGLHH